VFGANAQYFGGTYLAPGLPRIYGMEAKPQKLRWGMTRLCKGSLIFKETLINVIPAQAHHCPEYFTPSFLRRNVTLDLIGGRNP
jgi:hypothetical protein